MIRDVGAFCAIIEIKSSRAHSDNLAVMSDRQGLIKYQKHNYFNYCQYLLYTYVCTQVLTLTKQEVILAQTTLKVSFFFTKLHNNVSKFQMYRLIEIKLVQIPGIHLNILNLIVQVFFANSLLQFLQSRVLVQNSKNCYIALSAPNTHVTCRPDLLVGTYFIYTIYLIPILYQQVGTRQYYMASTRS